MDDTSLTKSARARLLGCARSTLYSEKKKVAGDWELKCRIEEALREFPSYGFRRVAMHLRMNKKPVQRVMRIFGIQALCAALHHHPRPNIFHSDNGVEYNAIAFREILANCNIQISRSKKGCPGENGYQESFYDKFKVELADPNRFTTLGELVAEIYRTVYVYNTTRIHSALKMSPRQFAQLHAAATMHLIA